MKYILERGLCYEDNPSWWKDKLNMIKINNKELRNSLGNFFPLTERLQNPVGDFN